IPSSRRHFTNNTVAPPRQLHFSNFRLNPEMLSGILRTVFSKRNHEHEVLSYQPSSWPYA
ncbi:MAG: hypothetical protein IKC27_02445, partial [Kiritimatiellae bacterium]|nr:hypothetical protein [Kiritimatiellia bacterium]